MSSSRKVLKIPVNGGPRIVDGDPLNISKLFFNGEIIAGYALVAPEVHGMKLAIFVDDNGIAKGMPVNRTATMVSMYLKSDFTVCRNMVARGLAVVVDDDGDFTPEKYRKLSELIRCKKQGTMPPELRTKIARMERQAKEEEAQCPGSGLAALLRSYGEKAGKYGKDSC